MCGDSRGEVLVVSGHCYICQEVQPPVVWMIVNGRKPSDVGPTWVRRGLIRGMGVEWTGAVPPAVWVARSPFPHPVRFQTQRGSPQNTKPFAYGSLTFPMAKPSRAVAPVISTILLVAIAVILAATISVLVLDFGEEIQDPAPKIGQSSGEFVKQDGFEGGIIRIEHIAGDSVPVEEIEVAVDATDACGETARVQNLPAFNNDTPYSNPDAFSFGDDNLVRGSNSIISKGSTPLFQKWDAGVLHKDTDNTFDAGSEFEFRIGKGACQLNNGDKITVRVVHVPSNAVIIKQELTA